VRRYVNPYDLFYLQCESIFEHMGREPLTSQLGYSSATSMAHKPEPYPQSRIFFGSAMGGNISRPSKALRSTLCWRFSLSTSSYGPLGQFLASNFPPYKKELGAVHFINRSEIYRVLEGVLLKLTVVDRHRTQIAAVERRRVRIRIAIILTAVSLPQSVIDFSQVLGVDMYTM
jgi:hypothetical protein